MENKAKTTVTGSARMPDVEDVGEKGMEGAKKTLGAVIDGMMPVLAKGKSRGDSDDEDKRRKPNNNNNNSNKEEKKAHA